MLHRANFLNLAKIHIDAQLEINNPQCTALESDPPGVTNNSNLCVRQLGWEGS